MKAQEHGIPRLLAIDDSALIIRLLRTRLKHERIDIASARNGSEGLAEARRILPDVILLDLDLPDMDGFDVLRELKADSRTHDIPVIIVSGSTSTPSKVKGLEMGAVDFVTKPFDLAELKARVRSAVRIQQLIRMLAQRAQLDGLTGLWNRTYFDDRLADAIADAQRHRTEVSLIMCDLDRFKSLNDEHGHPFGDHVLEVFAQLLASGRVGDIPCRYGGEEFGIILPHTNAEEALKVAERIRTALREQTWEGHHKLTVTASLGVTDMASAGEATPRAMIEAADQALYAAKEAGRDRVAVAPRRSPQMKLSA